MNLVLAFVASPSLSIAQHRIPGLLPVVGESRLEALYSTAIHLQGDNLLRCLSVF